MPRRQVARRFVTEAWPPAVTRVLPRGDWQNETGDVVPPAVPHFLPQHRRRPASHAARFGEVARPPRQPLTARTFVNRLWKQFFGAGLSGVLDDLGAQGESPTHAELSTGWPPSSWKAAGTSSISSG